MTLESSPLIVYDSVHSVTKTLDRSVHILESKGVTIFARINHSTAAKKAGLTMQDEEVLVFGDPRVGTALMLEQPAIGIELPLKIIAWSLNNITKVGYQNLERIAQNYNISRNLETISHLQTLLANLGKQSIVH